jgi:hypothetical protein
VVELSINTFLEDLVPPPTNSQMKKFSEVFLKKDKSGWIRVEFNFRFNSFLLIAFEKESWQDSLDIMKCLFVIDSDGKCFEV